MPRRRFEEEIDITATVTTPENVRFDYKLAGPSRRFPAFLIDLCIRAGSFLIIFFFLSCTGLFATNIGFAFVSASMLIVYFLMSWFYGAMFEYLRNGRTPGKSALGIQVVMADGRPVNLVAAMIRNLCRTADIMPVLVLSQTNGFDEVPFFVPLFLPSLVCMFITQRFQRLGDIAANTMVVIVEPEFANRFAEIKDARMESIASQLPPDLVLQPSTVQALSLYIDRRMRLNAAQREESSSILLDAIRTQYELPKDESNDALVCAMHYREFYMRDDKIEFDKRESQFIADDDADDLSISLKPLPSLVEDFPQRTKAVGEELAP